MLEPNLRHVHIPLQQPKEVNLKLPRPHRDNRYKWRNCEIISDYSLETEKRGKCSLPPYFRSDYKNVNWKKDWETIIRKISMIERCLPVSSIIDFGGMWEVDGLYSRVCVEKFNIPKVTMIDKFESENWVQNPRLRANIDFRKGDFSDESFMADLKGLYDLALAYDVLLHQREPDTRIISYVI